MRYLCIIIALGVLSAAPSAFAQQQEEEPLLLLDDESDAAESEGADNSRCQVCHLNFTLEEIAVVHAREEIGCVDCHGDCDEHIDDESWASGGPGTAPGVMFPREDIAPACRRCHANHGASEMAMQARAEERSLKNANDAVCTECHGKHRVNPKLRKAWWDKRTGEPVKPPKPR